MGRAVIQLSACDEDHNTNENIVYTEVRKILSITKTLEQKAQKLCSGRRVEKLATSSVSAGW
jgi:hypothetical protein